MKVPAPGRLTAVVAAGSLVGCLLAGLLRPAPPAVAEASVQPVSRAVLVCPRPTTDATTQTSLGLVAPQTGPASSDGSQAGEAAPGLATLTALAPEADPSVELKAPGTAAVLAVEKAKRSVPVVASGEGALAPALAAGQVSTILDGSRRGLLATACVAPSGDSWFVGGGGTVGRRTTVYLTNPDSTQAVVDVEVYGPDGVVAVHGGSGVAVPPRGQRAVRVDVVAPGVARAAIHVVARAGRVAAAVEDVNTKGLIPLGADYVPQAGAPALHVVVPGVLGVSPGAKGQRLLQVVAPGDSDAIVNVKVVAEDGSFAPESAALLEIPAGSVAQVDLAPFLAGSGAAGVLLDSDSPVVAGVRTVLPAGGGRSESMYSAGVAALTGPAAFGPVSVNDAQRPSLSLTAADPEVDVVVTITMLDPEGGPPRTQDLTVAAGTSVRVVLSGPATGAGLVVTPAPGSGPLWAALLLLTVRSDGSLRSTVPLVSGDLVLAVPPVRPDPATGVPGH